MTIPPTLPVRRAALLLPPQPAEDRVAAAFALTTSLDMGQTRRQFGRGSG